MARGEEVLFCEARVSLGMVVVDVWWWTTSTLVTLVGEEVGVGATFSRYVGTSKEDYHKVCTYLHFSLALFPALLLLTFSKKLRRR